MTRKEKTETKLRKLGIPVNPHLPEIESNEEVALRPAEEVARRAIGLFAVAVRGEGLEKDEVLGFLRGRGFEDEATPKEKEFLFKETPTEQEKINFTWRYESLWVLLWALGLIEELDYPSSICDVPKAAEIIVNSPATTFVNEAKLRSVAEILDEADLIYRYDWAVVDARIKGLDAPCDLDPGVVYERHYALNWLIGYFDQHWDDVTTDT